MRILKNARYLLAGWLAGVVTIFALNSIWPIIFPGIVQAQHYDSPAIGLPFILAVTLVIATPAALIGGLVGSRLPREGGRAEQTIVAALIGAILVIPFGCASLWVFSGY